MLKSFVLISLICCSFCMFCNYYPMDPLACISKTEGIMCQFSVFENACVPTQSTNLGCSPQLNKRACLNQLRNIDGNEAKCYFGSRCVEAKEHYLQNLGCSPLFNRNSCASVKGKICYWDGQQCQEIKTQFIEAQNCQSAYNVPVTPSACALIIGVKCKSGLFQNDYECQNVLDAELNTLGCKTEGLNKEGCLQIEGQKCIFENNECNDSSKINSCDDYINKDSCLGIVFHNITCVWKQNKCQVLIVDNMKTCEDYVNVSPSVCAIQDGYCQFKDGNCIKPQLHNQKCNDLGLSRLSCLSIKGDNCTYINNRCEQLNEIQLIQISCNELNEDACVNVKTQFQFCKWTGEECVGIFINQDIDCPIQNDNNLFKFNGNVCQAISKPGVRCKYNNKTHLCEKTIESDTCTTPFLNLNACVSILKYACQWTSSGCNQATIIQEQTSCLDLGFANQIACSQILKSDEDGCYYDTNSQQCRLVSDQLLNEIKCTGMGLNRIGCALVLTTGQLCRWYNNQCQQIKHKNDVQAIYCLQMQYVNPATCALVEAGNEVCRYEKNAKGCVNSLNTETMTCSFPGLNAYACAQIQLKSCYYDKDLWQCKQITVITANTIVKKQTDKLLSNSDCVTSSPTPDVCRSITKASAKCSWLFRENRCSNQYVTFNESCLDYNTQYTGKNILINANVCASIEMEQPDYDALKGPLIDKMKGYCIFEGGNCTVFKGICGTPCCSEFVGINSHVCGRYSTGQYCYFSNELKCTELTMDIVDITIEKQVKDYYNSLQLKCSYMNKNSCHMIEWSTQQRCYFNGNLCVNINFSQYPNLNIFTADTAILNKYACLAIEAMKTVDNSAMFFGYEGKHCKLNPDIIDVTDCGSTELNSNACQMKYPEIYCRWSKSELKCKSVDSYYVENLTYCDQNLNEFACVNIPNASCFFSYQTHKCTDAPNLVECGYFGSVTGTVSRLACMNIKLDGQICGYDDKKFVCKDVSAESDTCDLPDGNAIACYAKTKGDCRWDEKEMLCYENDKPLTQLGCEDNVNMIICLKITTQPCEWDIIKLKCLRLKSNQFQLILPDNLYNAEACVQVFGAPYKYDPNTYLCSPITAADIYKEQKDPEDPLEPNILCDGSMLLNVDACLFSTMLQKCYFDKSQSAEKRCQAFIGIQTSCDSPYQISLQMCAEVPQSCYFVKSSYECKYIKIEDSTKCSDLRDQSEQYLFNKIACSSINYEYAEYGGTLQCFKSSDPDNEPDQEFLQQCQVEKYCKWDQQTTTCQLTSLKTLAWMEEEVEITDGDGNTSKGMKRWCEEEVITFEDDCSNIYSKGACLQLSSICAFDIQMGGCFEIAGNEKQILSCEGVIGSNCLKSLNPNAPCVIDDSISVVFPKIDTCFGYPNNEEQICKQTAPSKCKDAEDLGQVSPIVCSKVSDNCYYDGTKCSSDTKKKKCNETFSQLACLSNGCDFTLGFCQDVFKSPSFDSLSPFYLYQCQYISKLSISSIIKRQVCVQMDFPCAFQNEQCVAAAQAYCQTLNQLPITKQACIYCIGGSYSYDSTTNYCNSLVTQQIGCNDTNKDGCLSMTTGKNCTWKNGKCIEQSNSEVENLKDCSLTNSFGCPKVANSCWTSPITKFCSMVDVYSTCKQIKQQNGNQLACIISNLQSCQWLNNACEDYPLDSLDCTLTNKYGCLNLTKVPCGWSEENQQCYSISYKSTITKCTEFFDSNKKLIKFNSQSCQQIQDVPCFRDRTQKCNEIGLKDKITCETIGLNKLGCYLNSTGYCQFIDGQCQTIPDLSKITCTSPINKVTCFSLKLTCKFVDNECQDYDVSTFTTIAQITKEEIFPYSPSVCQYYKEIEGKALLLIYDSVKGCCLDGDLGKPFIYDCNSPGLNELTCLKQTKPTCQFINSKCQTLTNKMINDSKICDPTFNWNACVQLKLKCKFYQNKCQPVEDSETCLSLANIIASPLTCSSRSIDLQACIFDSLTYSCKISISTTLSCTQSGLNKYGCTMNTDLEFCRFNDIINTCMSTYETNLSCQHLTNENKCLFIKTAKQYCKFDNGCSAIDPLQVISCYDLTPTNPMTCTAAESVACKYDRITQKCVAVLADMDLDEPQSNMVSFNKLACMKYQTDNKQVIYTTEGCIEVDPEDLANLTCDQPVNQFTCSQITNPTQYCIYKDYKCQFILPTEITIKSCANIGYVNQQEYCEQSDDVPCKFNSFTKLCEEIDLDTEPITSCIRGINKLACESLASCRFDQFCLEISKSCAGSTDCTNVNSQPCKLDNNNNCILATELTTLNCDQVINKLACIKITTPLQYCRFSQSLCQSEDLIEFKNEECENITNINSPYFCEQPTDIACRYDQFQNRCVESLPTDNMDCIRGLNEYACLNYTKPSLRCRFTDFCYGPTQPMFECDNTLFDCCNKAPDMNTCLLQNLLDCQWDGTNCIKYTNPITTCTLLNTSKLTCIKSTDKNCLFDLSTKSCIQILEPTSCDQLQSAEQCQMVLTIPCIWINEQCKYHESTVYEECVDITSAFGSMRACLNIVRSGQMCQFKEGQCSSYFHDSDQCLDNINKVACISQTTTKCYWKVETIQIKKLKTSQPIPVDFGTCASFVDDKITLCNENLSYLSCFSITTLKQNCKWLNGKCISIPISDSIVTPQTHALVNINACALVDTEPVYYDSKQHFCVKVQPTDSIACLPPTPGLNMKACLTITNQRCRWNFDKQQCEFSKSKINRQL
ncbi:unnamed protein product [Paramecium primaurelia]|uniref:Uncharacterized protein n=1 Tax=Paramecium primaurelia TaxID=5886 RepID=A0A8S1K808_PARPR|nr:unnamed protein product [Paramecium primaurelia]